MDGAKRKTTQNVTPQHYTVYYRKIFGNQLELLDDLLQTG